MVTKFTVFGSCACRDIFYSKINENYKKYFSIDEDGIRISLISLMQKPVQYDNEQLIILPQNNQNIRYSNWIKKDFEKTFIDYLKNEDIEYLLFDTYYDVNFGVIQLDDGSYITKNLEIEKTDFYKNLKSKRILTIHDNCLEYFPLWKEHCNLFFDFIEHNCPNIKLILNPNRHVYNVLNSEGKIIQSDLFKSQCEKHNLFRNLLDEYILRNFDVDVLMFDDDILADENHVWGPYSLHYTQKYYVDATNQLNEIINRNKVFDTSQYYSINKNVRKEKREMLLLKFKSQYTNEFNELKSKLNLEKL